MPEPKIHFREAKKNLTTVWFVLSAVPFLILAIQTAFNRYGQHTAEVWAWLLPQIMPTLGVTVAIWFADSHVVEPDRVILNRYAYRMAFFLSIAYLTLVACVFLIEPFVPREDSLQMFSRSNFFLAPLQALTGALLGVFFSKEHR